MEDKNVDKMYLIPPRGYIQEIAKLAGCDRRTVWLALRYGANGKKAERVRAIYRAKYM